MTQTGSGPAPRNADFTEGITAADLFTAARIPLAVAFPLVEGTLWRGVILGTAAATDLLDGWLARRFGGSRLGAFLDPLADKLFMASAFVVVLLDGLLSPLEVVVVMLRDLVATFAFAVTVIRHQPSAIPARWAGKAVTVAQVLTLVAFLAESAWLRPLAWMTGVLGLYAIWDYFQVSDVARQNLRLNVRPPPPSPPHTKGVE